MGDQSTIEWTRGDDGSHGATWNPVTGCTKVSAGCDHCYAESIAHRFAGTKAYPNGFDITLRPDRLNIPLRWRKPRRIFVNSMSDLFHQDIPDEFIAQVFAVMATTQRHTFQLLTKRHARLRSLLSSDRFMDTVADRLDAHDVPAVWPLPNLWVGVSVENQQWADIRIPALLDTPAAIRWLSCEPLLGSVSLHRYVPNGRGEGARHNPRPSSTGHLERPTVDWVVVGGESGPRSRPMQPEWAQSLRDQCSAVGVPFFMKQAGQVLAREWRCASRKGDVPAEWPESFPQEYPHAA